MPSAAGGGAGALCCSRTCRPIVDGRLTESKEGRWCGFGFGAPECGRPSRNESGRPVNQQDGLGCFLRNKGPQVCRRAFIG